MDSPTSSVKFFLPRRYDDVVSDLEATISQRVALLLIYKGTCPRSNSCILELKRVDISFSISLRYGCSKSALEIGAT